MNNVTVNESDVLVSVVPDEINVTITDAVGIPPGGTANQVLKKNSATDYDVSWASDVAGVPYTGATQDVNLGEFGLLTGNIEFDTSPTNAPTGAGSMVWNDTEGTADLMLKGASVNLPLGQKQVLRAVNGTGGNLTRATYRAVKITGAQGQRLQVSLARADNDANSKDTIGLVAEDIGNNQEGFIVTSGTIANINTTGSLQGETWVDGDTLYLSGTTSGVITNVKPTAPIHTVILGFVIYAHANNGKIYVKPDNGYELDELHNVSAPTPTSGEYLRYNGTLWADSSILAADLPTGIDAAKIATGVVSNTEFGYLDGVTSAIQTQLNGKQATLTNPVTGTGTTNYVAKFTGTSAVGDSQIQDNGASGVLFGTRITIREDAPFITGANITSSGNNFALGTTGGSALQLFTNSVERIRISAVGTVGINATAALTALSVYNATANAAVMEVRGGGGSSQTRLQLTFGNTTSATLNGDIFASTTDYAIRAEANRVLWFGTTTSGTSLERMRINAGGNVSIGNTNNTYNLDVSGTLRNTTSAYFATSSGGVGIGKTSITTNYLLDVAGSVLLDTNGTGGQLAINAYGVLAGRIRTPFDGTGYTWLAIDVASGGSLLFTGNTTEWARFNSSGNFGIGTTSPSYKLDVSGTLRNTTDAYFATSSGDVRIGTTTGTVSAGFTFLTINGSSYGALELRNGGALRSTMYHDGSNLTFTASTGGMAIGTANAERVRISIDGNVGLGQTTFGGSATKTLAVSSGTAPTTSPADAFQMYSADITAGNAAAHFRTEGGAVIKLYQQTTGVAAATFAANSGTAVNDASTFDGYTLNQIVKALRNNGLLA